MKVLVTGSRGYVGSALCDLLAKQGMRVVGYDAGYFDGKQLFPRSRNGFVSFTKKDIRSMDKHDFQGIDSVIHLAALSNDPAGNLDPGLTERINRKESVRLAKLAKSAGVKRFILASSCSIYGVQKGEAHEGSEVLPLTPYAKSKVWAEADIRELSGKGFSPVYLRSATVYGPSPRMRFDLVLNDFAAMAHLYKKITLASDGTASRPLVHVNDLARAYHHLLVLPKEEVADQAFNLAQDNRTVLDLAELVSEAYDDCPVIVGKSAGVDVRDYRVSAKKLARTGFRYEWPLQRGISEMQQLFKRVGLDEETYRDPHFWTVNRYKKLIESGLVKPDLTWKPSEDELQAHLSEWVGN